jgi:hypothetical protein
MPVRCKKSPLSERAAVTIAAFVIAPGIVISIRIGIEIAISVVNV